MLERDQPVPVSKYRSWTHYLEIDEIKEEDTEDVVDHGGVGVEWTKGSVDVKSLK